MFDHKQPYRHFRAKVYKFLERPYGTVNVIYHFSIFSFILLTLSLSAFLSLKSDEAILQKVLFSMELSLAIYFGIEFTVRVWSASADAKYQGIRGRLRFMTRVLVIVDIIILLSTTILLSAGTKDATFVGSKTIQNLRFLQILRLLHVDRQATTWKMMEKIIKLHTFSLLTAYYLAVLSLLIMAAVVYITEYEMGKKTFRSFGDALWWGVVTLMTVGYGDIVPQAWLSKVFTCIFAFICVSLFSAASTIIGVGLTLMVSKKERRKQRRKQRPFAAQLIQSFYRHRLITTKFYQISYYSDLSKRLLIHEIHRARKRQKTAEHVERKPSTISRLFRRVRKISTGSGKKHETGSLPSTDSRVNIVASFDDEMSQTEYNQNGSSRPHAMSLQMPRNYSLGDVEGGSEDSRQRTQTIVPSITVTAADSCDNDVDSDVERGSNISRSRTSSVISISDDNERSRSSSICSFSDYPDQSDFYPSDNEFEQKNNEHISMHPYETAVIAAFKLKFLMAKLRFKRARRPYELDDISVEVSEKEMQQLSKLRELQIHIEKITGKPNVSLVAKHRHTMGLCQRMELIEQKMNGLEKKIDLITDMATQVANNAKNGYH